jgi:RNA polymerase sigma-70 factor (ECF subfamily)
MTQPVDDELACRLIGRVALRDEAAFTDLHRLLARRIFAFVMRRLPDEYAAQTVVVDTMLQVWNSAARFRGESRVSSWVLGIARLKSLEYLRAQGPEHLDIEDYSEELADAQDDAGVAMDRWQQARIVQECMKSLSNAQRECLHLVHYEGLALADVASVQGVPENTVKTRLFHARKNMRICVEREGVCA